MLLKGLISSVSIISMTLDIYLLAKIVITRGLYLLLLSVWLDHYRYSMDCKEKWLHTLFHISVQLFCQDKCCIGLTHADIPLNLPPWDLFDAVMTFFAVPPSYEIQTRCPAGRAAGSRNVTHLISFYTDVTDISECHTATKQIRCGCNKRCLGYCKC